MAHSAAESVSSQPDRPERSRNAKAQARHRAKRKAYIEQVSPPQPPQTRLLTFVLFFSSNRQSLNYKLLWVSLQTR